MKTIRQIADEIGVSKTAVSKQIENLGLRSSLRKNGNQFAIDEHQEALIKQAFFEKTPAEQKRAVVSQPEEVRDALRRAHAAKAAQDMFLCLPELSKEKAAFKRSKGEAAQKESAGRMASLEKEMKECRRTVVAFMRGNTVPAVLRRGSPER